FGLDPIRRYSVNVDKGPAEVRLITASIKRIVIETQATAGIVHHDVKPPATGKDDRRRSHKASGGDWFAASECPISFERISDTESMLIPSDYKLSTDPQSFQFRLETDDPRNPTIARLIGDAAAIGDAETIASDAKVFSYVAEHSGCSTRSIH